MAYYTISGGRERGQSRLGSAVPPRACTREGRKSKGRLWVPGADGFRTRDDRVQGLRSKGTRSISIRCVPASTQSTCRACRPLDPPKLPILPSLVLSRSAARHVRRHHPSSSPSSSDSSSSSSSGSTFISSVKLRRLHFHSLKGVFPSISSTALLPHETHPIQPKSGEYVHLAPQ